MRDFRDFCWVSEWVNFVGDIRGGKRGNGFGWIGCSCEQVYMVWVVREVSIEMMKN